MSTKTAKCERSGKDIELTDGYLIADASTGEWSFVGPDADENAYDYFIEFEKLLRSPAGFVDWMAHLNEKSWFDPRKFFAFFERLREKNNLYNAL